MRRGEVGEHLSFSDAARVLRSCGPEESGDSWGPLSAAAVDTPT